MIRTMEIKRVKYYMTIKQIKVLPLLLLALADPEVQRVLVILFLPFVLA